MAEDNVAALQLRLTEVEQEKQLAEEQLSARLAQLSDQQELRDRDRERQESNLSRQLEAARRQIGK